MLIGMALHRPDDRKIATVIDTRMIEILPPHAGTTPTIADVIRAMHQPAADETAMTTTTTIHHHADAGNAQTHR